MQTIEQNDTDIWQSVVCIIAIMICKQLGMITNLAPFDSKKAKTCKKVTML